MIRELNKRRMLFFCVGGLIWRRSCCRRAWTEGSRSGSCASNIWSDPHTPQRPWRSSGKRRKKASITWKRAAAAGPDEAPAGAEEQVWRRLEGRGGMEAATRQKEEPGGGIKPAITSSDARRVHNYTTTQRCSADVSRKLIHRLNVDDNLGLLYAFTCKLI